MTVHEIRTLVDDLMYAEAPRWRDGLLYISDFTALEVVAINMDGERHRIASVAAQPSGTGWMPNGDMLIVSMNDARLLRLSGGSLTEVADVSATSPSANDLVVDAHGRAYMGGMPNASAVRTDGTAPAPADFFEHLYLITPSDNGDSASVQIVASEMEFPNGGCITPDGQTLIVAESTAKRLTAFDIADDGTLHRRRVWADLDEVPDGICLDAEGCIWVAVPSSPRETGFLRVAEGGQIVDRVPSNRAGMAVMLGGPEGRHLFMIEAQVIGRGGAPELRTRGNARVRVGIADVPHAGLP